MRNWSRRLLLAASALSVAAVVPRPAGAVLGVADTVICTNCSTLWQQAAQLAKEASSLETQLQMKVTQLLQYQNMLTNTVALPMQVWGTVQSDLMQVRNLSNAGSILSGNAGGLVSRLQAAGGYANQAAMLPSSLQNQFSMWQTTMGNSLNTFGRTLGLQQTQSASDAALIQAIQAHSTSAQGQMQAIQAGVEMASMNAQQLMQIRQTIAANGQVQAGWIAVQADRQATEDAALQRFLAAPDLPTSGGRSW